MPSPARAETGSTVAPGLIFPRSAVQRARSKSTWGSRSVLLTSTRPALRNMCGYLTGLSAPSVTEASTTRCASPRSNRAGQTRFPTFSITTTEPSGELVIGVIEVAPGPGVDLHHPAARRAHPVRVQRGLLVPLDDPDDELAGQVARGPLEQRGLARAGRAHQVEREDAPGAQPVPVLRRERVVAGQHLLFQRDGLPVGVLVLALVPGRVVGVPGPVVVLVPGPGAVGAAAGRAHLTPPGP